MLVTNPRDVAQIITYHVIICGGNFVQNALSLGFYFYLLTTFMSLAWLILEFYFNHIFNVYLGYTMFIIESIHY